MFLGLFRRFSHPIVKGILVIFYLQVGDANFDERGNATNPRNGNNAAIADKPHNAQGNKNGGNNTAGANANANAGAGVQSAPMHASQQKHAGDNGSVQPGSGRGNGQATATGGLYGSGLAKAEHADQKAEQPAQHAGMQARRAERSNSRAERGDRTKSMPQKSAGSEEHVAFLNNVEREQKRETAAEKTPSKKPSEAL